MVYSRILRVFLILGLIALLVPVTLAQAQGGSGTAVIRDSGALSDAVTLTMTDVPPPAAGSVYEGWLVSDDGSRKLSTGILSVTDGEIDQQLTAASFSSLQFTLVDRNDSGQSGWALLSTVGNDLQVDLTLSASDPGVELAHIHTGQCGATLGGVAYGLTSFAGGGGSSTITLEGVTLAELRTGGFAINTHEAGSPGVYPVCGNIPTVGDGENLFGAFDKFVITIEPVPDTDPGPSADVAYIHTIPAGGIAHIRHLLYSLGGNPAYTSGAHEGIPKGIAVGLREQTEEALLHAQLAQGTAKAGNLALTQLHACHVVNILEGYSADNDRGCAGPGDTFGVLNYAAAAALHAGLTELGVPNDPTIAEFAPAVVASANASAEAAAAASTQVTAAMNSNVLVAARIYIDNVERLLRSDTQTHEGALYHARHAYTSSQDMGTYTLAELPGVGDPLVPQIAKGGLIIGIILALAGLVLYVRARPQLRKS